MSDLDTLAATFEDHREHLFAVAYRVLGSRDQADDAVQEAWLRLARSDHEAIENLGGWLTTVVARIALDTLRARAARPEDSLETRIPDPIVTAPEGTDPEAEALLSDSVGLALLVVLQRLEPAERLAFVLHDMFAVPFSDIAAVVDRTPDAARQLASRARRRVRSAEPTSDVDVAGQREVFDAFRAASREGDFEKLCQILDPDIVLRADGGPDNPQLTMFLRGAPEVAENVLRFRRLAETARPVLINGHAGVVSMLNGKPFSTLSLTVRDGRITALDILADPERIAALDLEFLETEQPGDA